VELSGFVSVKEEILFLIKQGYNMNTLIISIGIFIILLAILVGIRAKAGTRFEVKNTDILLALIPIALWLLLTGKVQEFGFGDFKIVAAIQKATQTSVAAQVTKLPVETIHTEMKGGVEMIPQLLEKKTQALSFRLGTGGYYYGPAINEYFQALTKSPSFKYIVITNADNTFFGIADAQQMGALFNSQYGNRYSDDFARWLNSSDIKQLSAIPGFISSEKALNNGTDKQQALRLMDSLDVQTLPVIADKQFVGIVDRAKLTASVLIDIADRVEK
jgi:hypothetical protein